ncbi:MAG: hypothetical protein IPK15_27335 [Verrucomicrobia bacterium]|nr:hypothetical protein [Verrucomicrobiota bacterium]
MQDEFRTGLLQARSAFAKPLANSSAFDMQSLTEQMSNLEQLCDFYHARGNSSGINPKQPSMENVFNEVYLILRTAPPEAVANTLTFDRDAHATRIRFVTTLKAPRCIRCMGIAQMLPFRAPNFV